MSGRTVWAWIAALFLGACHGGGGAVGEACKGNGDCASGNCKDEASSGYPGGMCTADCSSSSCSTGNLCVQLSGQSLCARSCAKDSDCRSGYGCCAASGNVCLPPAVCTAPACQRPVVASSYPASQVIGFGVHKVGDQLSFNVPANTGSITIMQQARSAGLNITYKSKVYDNSAVPGILNFPNGTEAYNDYTQGDPTSPDGGVEPAVNYAFYGGGTPSTGAFTIPNTTTSLAQGLPSGTWKFTVNDYAYECTSGISGCTAGASNTDTYDVSVLLRPMPAGSNLDVNFYIVANVKNASGQQFTAASAPTDPSVQRMLQTLRSLYSQVGINIRNVSFYDTSAADQARFGTSINADKTGPCDELNQMLLLSAAHPGNTVNLFLVQSITANQPQPGGVIVGIDGTIPGPSSFAGTVHSGAAVSLANLFKIRLGGACAGAMDTDNCGADQVAYVAAHETGHFLGLFHPTERTGDLFDPVADTPKCPCMNCASSSELSKCPNPDSSGPTLSADLCASGSGACAGGDNLMFWQLYSTSISKGRLSAQQGSVMRLNAAIQ